MSKSYEIPTNIDAERRVLSACLQSTKALNKILSMLKADDFYLEPHRVLYSAIKTCARETQGAMHVNTLMRYLPSGDYKSVLNDIANSPLTAANSQLFARDIISAARARAAMDAADRLKRACASGLPQEYEDAPQKAISELEDLVRDDRSEDKPAHIKRAMDRVVEKLWEAKENKGVTGIRTGIGGLDNAIKGLVNGRMYVLAGRPGSGKSLLCGQIALNVARQGKKVLICSPEMTVDDYLMRLACAAAGISVDAVEDGKVTEQDINRISKEAARISSTEFLVIDDGTQTVSDVRRFVMRYEPDLLIVDYMQRLTPENRGVNKYEQVSQISFDLDRIKKDFGIPVIAAAQLNRSVDSRQDKRPVMSDLRDSGTIEQDADAIGMLYRPAHYDDHEDESLIHFELEKNRHGSLFATDLYTDEGLWISDSRFKGVA